MSLYRFHSTMLPENVEVVFDTGEDKEFDEFIEEAEQLFAKHDATAEFRVRIDDPPETCADNWLLKHAAARNIPALDILKLLYAGEDWDDKQTVMAAHYCSHYDDADNIIEAVNAGDYAIDYAKDEDDAYRDFGEYYYGNHDSGDLQLGDYRDYFDFCAYGRDIAEDMLQYVDDHYYVLKEWH